MASAETFTLNCLTKLDRPQPGVNDIPLMFICPCNIAESKFPVMARLRLSPVRTVGGYEEPHVIAFQAYIKLDRWAISHASRRGNRSSSNLTAELRDIDAVMMQRQYSIAVRARPARPWLQKLGIDNANLAFHVVRWFFLSGRVDVELELSLRLVTSGILNICASRSGQRYR